MPHRPGALIQMILIVAARMISCLRVGSVADLEGGVCLWAVLLIGLDVRYATDYL